ncbi:xylulokinase [Rothia uropygialis]|uniref:xylulokinase n=1 Tax=Kocuria sp. 36 TaxID=1415402 RepID=UPI00101BCA3C|nr:FGGY-family carbohydrate kinase [Kocuria sp. 36]
MTRDDRNANINETRKAARVALENGDAYLGIELGSTRIKSCAVLSDGTTIGTGIHFWESHRVDEHWSYDLDDVWAGVAASYADLVAGLRENYAVAPRSFRALGVSAMMHGYLAFDSRDELLVPFRTWRDTTTAAAAEELTDLFQINIPLRWSIAHLRQAVLDREDHVSRLSFLTTLSGYVHWRLTGEKVVGIGDASGMFPIDSAAGGYDERLIQQFNAAFGGDLPSGDLRTVLPRCLCAGQCAGVLTEAGARLLDPSGELHAGIPLCPPEGDAGTGMVATNAVRSATGNVSVGTSIFAMVVLDKQLSEVHHEIDLVATPAGADVAMVHCNSGSSELSQWVSLFTQVASAFGTREHIDLDEAYSIILTEALSGDTDAGGLLSFNNVAGEPVMGFEEGRPLTVRSSDSRLTLSNFMRSQIYGIFAPLVIGLNILSEENVAMKTLSAHGGLFKTAGVAQRFLAAATKTPVVVSEEASEGGAWGIALLAAFAGTENADSLPDFLERHIFASSVSRRTEPRASDVAGFERYLQRYRDASDVQMVAGRTIR